MFYLIQNNLFSEIHYDKLLHSLERMQLDYEVCRLLPFVDEIEFATERKDVFCFGAVKMANIASRYGFNPGSMYNANHDFEVYGPKYGSLLLNHNAHVMKFADDIPATYPDAFFARPTGDTKLFNGQVFTKESWDEMLSDYKDGVNGAQFIGDATVMLSQLANIASEIRCWIVGGRVITMSQYRRGKHVIYRNMDSEEWLKQIVQSYVDVYQPAEAFVMDVCQLADSDEIKIIEINCINCAGFYDSNLPKLINALEEQFADR